MCKSGTYTDEKCSTKPKCCQKGTSASEMTRKHECDKCEAGSYQDKECQTECNCCSPGTYQQEEGKESCKNCACGK